MIISASRRTDIPNYYSEWFFNRIKEGFVVNRNPMYPEQLSKIDLSPNVIDAIVFWTKNPTPMLSRLSELDAYKYYFQFTLTPYDQDTETNVPSKRDVIIPAFQQLSKQIGREKVIWRYDPIFISNKYSIEYHIKYFAALASRLSDYTERCVISFLDYYGTNAANIKKLGIIKETIPERLYLAEQLSKIANHYGITLETCAEDMDLSQYGITHASCIDQKLLENICGYQLKVKKDPSQRGACNCVQAIDIGAYDGCKNQCAYCYAQKKGMTAEHDPLSPTLLGNIAPTDQPKERKMFLLKK